MEPRLPRTNPIKNNRAHPYERHVFVCTTGPECPGDGAAIEIRKALKSRVKAAGAKDHVRINNSGCLGQCGHGPMMVVYPDNVWYSHLDVAAATEILDAHVLGNGPPVAPHRYTLGPGGCKAVRNSDVSTSCDGTCRGGTPDDDV